MQKASPAQWRGIGIRIEDDVVVTRGEPEVITAAVPSDPDEIEALMARANSGSAANDAKGAKTQ